MKKSQAKQRASALERADIAVADAFTPIRDNPVIEAAGKLSDIGDQPPLYAISYGVIGAGLITGDRRTLRAGARMLASHIAAIFLKSLVKHRIDRTRPDVVADSGRYEMEPGDRRGHDFNSFPSGHTASSIAVARAVGRDYPELHGAALGVASAIAMTQVVRSSHFVSDVAAGAAIGLAAEALVDQVFRRAGV
ncbi:phosphatase PAP2 family protein [Sphingomonas sp.]|uniref:phosphatase PAP2 family protein n=1 Tax=Sphingomonas sp. TaxID=28214 RepID=UPI00286DD851|nr:phosphatase PAP2 family protein [Sphingomonas sp.]